METCLFCEIVKGTIPSHTVYEDDAVVAFLDIRPVNPGHLLIIPKAHVSNYLEAPIETVAMLARVTRQLAPAVLKAVGANAFNIGVNCGRDAGQVVFHLHFHLMPRFPDDGHQLWKGREEYAATLPEVAEKIKQSLVALG